MPMVTPSLNLPQPSASSAAKASAAVPAPVAAPATAPAPTAVVPSTTVTLSPQAMSAMAASHASSASSSAAAPAPAPVEHDSSIYDSLKNGIAAAVGDVGDAIAGGAHAVVDGVETTLSTINKVATGIVELPFAAVAKAADAVGALVDEL